MSQSRLQGESFGQKPPPLVKYLKDLIRDYPKGIGIIKEFVQNADDARASGLKILIDWRSYPTNNLPSPEMSTLMGPALLFFNDAMFTDKDLEGIQSLSEGSKAEDAGKTGRFGLGFNSAYNVTEVPSFVTRDRIYFFDPHGKTVLDAAPHDPGRSWALKALWGEAPDLLSPYKTLGLTSGQTYFPHTIFRLPFRTAAQSAKSQLSSEPFSREDVEGILETLERSGSELLLFLRHLKSIEVYEVGENATGVRRICSFKTLNGEEVQQRRDQLEARQTQSGILNLLKASGSITVTYKHEIEVATPSSAVTEVWRVVNGLYAGANGQLVDEVRTLDQMGEVVSPRAGAAALVSGRKTPLVQGVCYCFLPLPISTNLPVHLHGYFDLDRSRQKLTDGRGQTGKDARRGRWNELLIRHAVVAAYAELLVQLKEDVGQASPAAYYNYWPTAPMAPGLLEDLPAAPSSYFD